jgi:hypothetical protein
MKKCFKCNCNLHLYIFQKVSKDVYVREDWKGRVINCRICILKRALKQKGYLQKNLETKRFDWIEANKLQIIKYALK